jgi:hypothetical protein
MLKKILGVAVVVFFGSVIYANAMICMLGLLGKGHGNGHDAQKQTEQMKGNDTSARMHNGNESSHDMGQCGGMDHSMETHNDGSDHQSDHMVHDMGNIDEMGGS